MLDTLIREAENAAGALARGSREDERAEQMIAEMGSPGHLATQDDRFPAIRARVR